MPKNIVKENCLSHNMKSVSYLDEDDIFNLLSGIKSNLDLANEL